MRNISSKNIDDVIMAGHITTARIHGDALMIGSSIVRWLPERTAYVTNGVERDRLNMPVYHMSYKDTYHEGADGIRKYPIQVFDLADEQDFKNTIRTFAIVFTPNQQTDLQLWVDMGKVPVEISIRGGMTHLLLDMYLSSGDSRYNFQEGDFFSLQANETMILTAHCKEEWKRKMFEQGGCYCWLMHFNEAESIKQRIKREQIHTSNVDIKTSTSDAKLCKRVFIVHGRDNSMRNMVRKYLIELGLEPVILFEQPNEGKTVIEKLERELKTVSYAVVLMSHCDDGKFRKDKDMRHRARQNVIAEAGFFMGAKGRDKVSLIYKREKSGYVEKPSDFEGLSHIEYYSHSNWRNELKRELEMAGLIK